MKTKNPGISLLISFGTSFIVLTLAFATLDSIVKSLDQSTSIQRSTQLFFASETGLEAAFFHHNARGAGLNLSGNALTLDDVNANLSWDLTGRTSTLDDNLYPAVAGVLKENENIRIPFFWDNSTNISDDPSSQPAGNIDNSLRNITLKFYNHIDDIPASGNTAKQALLEEYEPFGIPIGFNFGDNGDGISLGDRGVDGSEVLIDWSIARKNSATGVQTFIPSQNADCANSEVGLICEDQLNIGGGLETISTGDAIAGRVLPNNIPATLNDFWNCDDDAVIGVETCNEYQLTFRPLLTFDHSGSGDKIPGIPFMLSLDLGGNTEEFPLNTYTINTDVDPSEDFSQQINLEITERSSVGAFDYVIFE